jgi:hypothetical protein
MERMNGVTPEEARVALESVNDAKKPLAPHTRSPLWLYPTLGLASAALVSGLALSKTSSWATTIIAVTVLTLAVLPSIPRPKARAKIDAFSHPRNTRIVAAYFVVLTSIAAAALALSHLPWAVVVAAFAALVWTVGVGAVLDTRLQRAFQDGR